MFRFEISFFCILCHSKAVYFTTTFPILIVRCSTLGLTRSHRNLVVGKFFEKLYSSLEAQASITYTTKTTSLLFKVILVV